jgi:hypothetical protein
MSLRFRRTMKIAPGIRLNLTKTGVSARVGPPGLGATVGTSGTTVSAGIPGTGLHASQKIKKGKSAASQQITHPATADDASSKGLGFFGWIGVVAVVFGLFWLIF